MSNSLSNVAPLENFRFEDENDYEYEILFNVLSRTAKK